jgi:hypothetical protein
VRIEPAFRRGIRNRVFGIHFGGEALHGLQSRGNRFLVGPLPAYFRIETLIDFVQSGVVRMWRVFGLPRRHGAGWLGEFLVSIHDSDRRAYWVRHVSPLILSF